MERKAFEQAIIETLRRGVHFGLRDVQPATNLYVALEDRLRVLIFNSVAGAEVDVNVRLQLPDGQVIPWRGQFFPTSNRASNSFEVDFAEGFLLDVSVSTPTAALRLGACYVVVQVIRGTGANAIVMRSLLANYLTTGMSVGWPEGPSAASVQDNGLVRSVQVSNPAAGSDWNVTVPTGARWQVQSVTEVFTASATVANRGLQLVADDGANILAIGEDQGSITAGQTGTFSFFLGANSIGGLAFNMASVAWVSPVLQQGFRVRSNTVGLQAGDQYSAIFLLVLEWIEQ